MPSGPGGEVSAGREHTTESPPNGFFRRRPGPIEDSDDAASVASASSTGSRASHTGSLKRRLSIPVPILERLQQSAHQEVLMWTEQWQKEVLALAEQLTTSQQATNEQLAQERRVRTMLENRVKSTELHAEELRQEYEEVMARAAEAERRCTALERESKSLRQAEQNRVSELVSVKLAAERERDMRGDTLQKMLELQQEVAVLQCENARLSLELQESRMPVPQNSFGTPSRRSLHVVQSPGTPSVAEAVAAAAEALGTPAKTPMQSTGAAEPASAGLLRARVELSRGELESERQLKSQLTKELTDLENALRDLKSSNEKLERELAGRHSAKAEATFQRQILEDRLKSEAGAETRVAEATKALHAELERLRKSRTAAESELRHLKEEAAEEERARQLVEHACREARASASEARSIAAEAAKRRMEAEREVLRAREEADRDEGEAARARERAEVEKRRRVLASDAKEHGSRSSGALAVPAARPASGSNSRKASPGSGRSRAPSAESGGESAAADRARFVRLQEEAAKERKARLAAEESLSRAQEELAKERNVREIERAGRKRVQAELEKERAWRQNAEQLKKELEATLGVPQAAAAQPAPEPAAKRPSPAPAARKPSPVPSASPDPKSGEEEGEQSAVRRVLAEAARGRQLATAAAAKLGSSIDGLVNSAAAREGVPIVEPPPAVAAATPGGQQPEFFERVARVAGGPASASSTSSAAPALPPDGPPSSARRKLEWNQPSGAAAEPASPGSPAPPPLPEHLSADSSPIGPSSAAIPRSALPLAGLAPPPTAPTASLNARPPPPSPARPGQELPRAARDRPMSHSSTQIEALCLFSSSPAPASLAVGDLGAGEYGERLRLLEENARLRASLASEAVAHLAALADLAKSRSELALEKRRRKLVQLEKGEQSAYPTAAATTATRAQPGDGRLDEMIREALDVDFQRIVFTCQLEAEIMKLKMNVKEGAKAISAIQRENGLLRKQMESLERAKTKLEDENSVLRIAYEFARMRAAAQLQDKGRATGRASPSGAPSPAPGALPTSPSSPTPSTPGPSAIIRFTPRYGRGGLPDAPSPAELAWAALEERRAATAADSAVLLASGQSSPAAGGSRTANRELQCLKAVLTPLLERLRRAETEKREMERALDLQERFCMDMKDIYLDLEEMYETRHGSGAPGPASGMPRDGGLPRSPNNPANPSSSNQPANAAYDHKLFQAFRAYQNFLETTLNVRNLKIHSLERHLESVPHLSPSRRLGGLDREGPETSHHLELPTSATMIC